MLFRSLFFFNVSYSQQSFFPGVTYSYVSLASNDTTKKVTFTLVMDTGGVATVRKAISSASGEVEKTYVLLNRKNWTGTSENGDAGFECRTSSDQYKIFVFDFTTNNMQPIINGGGPSVDLTVHCFCKHGGSEATCSPAAIFNHDGSLNVKCFPDAGCDKCKMTYEIGNIVVSGSSILFEATGIKY